MDVLHSFNLICWKKKPVSFLNLLLHLQVSAWVKAKSPVTRGSLLNLLPIPAFLWDSVGWWLPAQALDQTDVVSLLAQPFTSHITDPGPLLKWGLKHFAHRVSVSFKRVMHGKPLVSRLVLKKSCSRKRWCYVSALTASSLDYCNCLLFSPPSLVPACYLIVNINF